MEKKNSKVANLDAKTLYKMGDAERIQKKQLDSAVAEKTKIINTLNILENMNEENRNLLTEAEGFMSNFSDDDVLLLKKNIDVAPLESNGESDFKIEKVQTIKTQNNWDEYSANTNVYAKENSIDVQIDPFTTMLSQREYEKLEKEINDEFVRKTSIANKTDLSFLAVATALQTTKALLFPLVAKKVCYGEKLDKSTRLAHNDPSITKQERVVRDSYKEKKLKRGYKADEWIEILYRTPPYDIMRGSPSIGIEMEGGYHRIHTLGHDPILGWIFGTANILTDTITFDTFQTNKIQRKPSMIITPEQWSFFQFIFQTSNKIKENKMNLPAALFAEGIHLKSDIYTKNGLPIPVLETIAPKFAGKLYKSQYDTLCFARDKKVIGVSVGISLLIDMIIGLAHSLIGYNPEKDGDRDLFEVRTRKILLISNTIATTSNLIQTTITGNPKCLDIGGLLVTLSHMFLDTRFILNVKKEFIEKRIYEKIEDEVKTIEESSSKLCDFESKYKR
jgi:hypothetical protein